MSTPKFKINDQVRRRYYKGSEVDLESPTGTVTEVRERIERGELGYRYMVAWPDKSKSEHGQQILASAIAKPNKKMANYFTKKELKILRHLTFLAWNVEMQNLNSGPETFEELIDLGHKVDDLTIIKFKIDKLNEKS